MEMFRDDLLQGKRILVTGGGTGLGRVMTEKYAKLGAEVVIWGRRSSVLENTAEEIMKEHGGKVIPMQCDIRSAEDIAARVDEIWSDGPLDGLVNNAAGNFISPTKDLSANAFNAIAGIVFHGTFNTTNSVGRKWLEEGRKGSIISILVTWVWTGSPFVVPSAMSKSGVDAMTKSLAVEWGPHNIRLNAIAPGPFPTKGAWERLNPQSGAKGGDAANDYSDSVAMGRVGKMSELANLAAFLMADGCEYLTGQTIAIDGAQWMMGAGTFSRLLKLSDEQWNQIRETIKASNEKDKAQRG